jgi:hypothetical protein
LLSHNIWFFGFGQPGQDCKMLSNQVLLLHGVCDAAGDLTNIVVLVSDKCVVWSSLWCRQVHIIFFSGLPSVLWPRYPFPMTNRSPANLVSHCSLLPCPGHLPGHSQSMQSPPVLIDWILHGKFNIDNIKLKKVKLIFVIRNDKHVQYIIV